MDIKNLLVGKDKCECGMAHKCPIDHVIIGEDACSSLPSITKEYSSILLVADKNTYRVCGEAVHNIIKEKIADVLIYQTDGILVPDEETISFLEGKVTDATDLIIGIGSGVINDLCKIVSFKKGLRYFIVATAPSMDGYASKGSALILDGMKVTLNADVPKAIIADTKVLANAPFEMIQAGYGDIIGKYSCLNDWQLSACVYNEYLCPFVMNATYETVEKTVKLADGIREKDAEAIGALMEALVAVGILMAYVGSSRPASGSEHHLSHYFEITGLLDNRPYYLHGIDVLYSAAVTAKLREKVLACKPPFAPFALDRAAWERDIAAVYTKAADGVIALQDKIDFYGKLDTSVFNEKWDAICELLREAPDAAQMEKYVTSIGLDMNEFYRFYGEETINNALRYAKDLKDRYTVLWMAFALGAC